MLRSRVGALLVRPCSNVALLCNHDNKELKEDVDGCMGGGGWGVVVGVGVVSWYMICSAAIYVQLLSTRRATSHEDGVPEREGEKLQIQIFADGATGFKYRL